MISYKAQALRKIFLCVIFCLPLSVHGLHSQTIERKIVEIAPSQFTDTLGVEESDITKIDVAKLLEVREEYNLRKLIPKSFIKVTTVQGNHYYFSGGTVEFHLETKPFYRAIEGNWAVLETYGDISKGYRTVKSLFIILSDSGRFNPRSGSFDSFKTIKQKVLYSTVFEIINLKLDTIGKNVLSYENINRWKMVLTRAYVYTDESFGLPEMFIRINLFFKDGSNKSEYLLRQDNNGHLALVEDESVFVSIDENFQVLRMFKNNHPGFKIEADLALKTKDGGYKIHSYESIKMLAGYEEDRFYKSKSGEVDIQLVNISDQFEEKEKLQEIYAVVFKIKSDQGFEYNPIYFKITNEGDLSLFEPKNDLSLINFSPN